jgi:hypothetical protein
MGDGTNAAPFETAAEEAGTICAFGACRFCDCLDSSRNHLSPLEEKLMLKRILSFILAALMLHAAQPMPSLVCAQAGQVEQHVEKVKAAVAKRVGKKARVTVKLQDGSKLKGQISQAVEDSFTLTDSKTGQTRTLNYRDVNEVKGQGLSTLAKVGIVVGIAVVVLVIVVAVSISNFDLGNGPIIGGL